MAGCLAAICLLLIVTASFHFGIHRSRGRYHRFSAIRRRYPWPHDLSAVHHQDLVGVLDGGDPLGDDELGGIRDLLQKRLAIRASVLVSTAEVESRSGSGVLQQGPGDAKPPLLPAETLEPPPCSIGVVFVGNSWIKESAWASWHIRTISSSVASFAPAEIILDGAGEQHVLLAAPWPPGPRRPYRSPGRPRRPPGRGPQWRRTDGGSAGPGWS